MATAVSSLKLQTECSAVGPISLRRALGYHVDLLSPLTRTGLQAFAAYTQASRPHSGHLCCCDMPCITLPDAILLCPDMHTPS